MPEWIQLTTETPRGDPDAIMYSYGEEDKRYPHTLALRAGGDMYNELALSDSEALRFVGLVLGRMMGLAAVQERKT